MNNRSFGLALGLFLLPISAKAHHAMGNATPSTFAEGFVSGLAHPIIGLDHLLFVVALGAMCYYFARSAATILAFVCGTLAGTLIHVNKAALAYPDVWVAVTLVVLGALMVRGADVLRTRSASAIVSVCGIAHGYAYGEAIVGSEATPLVAYLTGFSIVQLAIALAAFAIVRQLHRARPALESRSAIGAALSLAGLAFIALSLA